MSLRRVTPVLYACCAVLLVGLITYPVRSGPVRLLIVLAGAVVIFGGLFFFKNKFVRWAGVSIILVGFALLFLPGRSLSGQELQSAYVQALRRYEATRYVWGGENALGVDCSGIVRAAWFDTQMRLGIKSANPLLLRRALTTWWFDASARELAAGHSGRTRVLHSAHSIRANQDAGLFPGDFAIVARGVHALAYLGDHTWIEADPGTRKVIVIKTSDASAWLDSSAVFVRWAELDESVRQP